MKTDKESLELLKSGNYAKKQIFAGCSILRWSHQSRFMQGRSLVKQFQPESLIDYGCGDGTFLIFLKNLVNKRIGMEIDRTQLSLLAERIKNDDNLSFNHVSADPDERAEMVTCLEVLEHCTEEAIEQILKRLCEICKPGGTIVISVPKETGLTMVGKQCVRRLLAWRKFGSYEYTEKYSFKDFFKMIFATGKTKVYRHYYEVAFNEEKMMTCGHMGFNWKHLKKLVEKHMEIKKIKYTPGFLPAGVLSSQVWFICNNRDV